MKATPHNSFYATIKVEGSTLMASFPGQDDAHKTDEEWLVEAQDSLLEWLRDMAETMHPLPSEVKIMRAGRCLLARPLDEKGLDKPQELLLH